MRRGPRKPSTTAAENWNEQRKGASHAKDSVENSTAVVNSMFVAGSGCEQGAVVCDEFAGPEPEGGGGATYRADRRHDQVSPAARKWPRSVGEAGALRGTVACRGQ